MTRTRILFAVVLVAALGAFTVLVLTGHGPGASADEVGRGAPVAVDSGPPRLDDTKIVRSFTRTRRSAHLPVLALSSCLDGVARRVAAEFGRGRVPASAASDCGSTSWGWVAGRDRSGAQMASAVVTRPAARGRSAFADRQWRHVGVAVGRRVVEGVASGYVLVWVVGR